jgi:hypothetical protein
MGDSMSTHMDYSICAARKSWVETAAPAKVIGRTMNPGQKAE